MRLGSEWSDVSIQNVSSRGLMARAETPPKQGAYIEIRKAAIVIVARAVWVKGQNFGVRTQDRLDIEALLQSAAAQRAQAVRRDTVVQERRRDPKRHADSIAAATARSQAVSRAIQFGALLAGLGFAAWLLADALSTAFATPLDAVRKALGGA